MTESIMQVTKKPAHIRLYEIGWLAFEKGHKPGKQWPPAMRIGWRAALRACAHADASAYLVAHKGEMVWDS